MTAPSSSTHSSRVSLLDHEGGGDKKKNSTSSDAGASRSTPTTSWYRLAWIGCFLVANSFFLLKQVLPAMSGAYTMVPTIPAYIPTATTIEEEGSDSSRGGDHDHHDGANNDQQHHHSSLPVGNNMTQQERIYGSAAESSSSLSKKTTPAAATTTTLPQQQQGSSVSSGDVVGDYVVEPLQHVAKTMKDAVMRTFSTTGGASSTTTTTAAINDEVKDDHVADPDQPLNIVLFYADDWTASTLGAVNPVVKTPHFDEMARHGKIFTHNCVTTSICWISRATLYTGMYAGRHQQNFISSDNMFNKTVNWSETLYPLLKKQGNYHTGFVGKWHSPAPGPFMKEAFDYQTFYSGGHWKMRDGKKRHITDLNQEDALHYLRKERPANQPFALTVSFFATHSQDGKGYPDQYEPMNKSKVWYENATIPSPQTATQEAWENMPWFFNEKNEARHRWRKRYNTPERYQVTMKRYYRMASEVDATCGAIIDELKQQGVYNNTLLIFTSDNGMFHNEHLLAGKWYPHKESVQVPLVIQDPRMPLSERGGTNDALTLSIDLAPTILSAAQVPVPPQMQGRDIADLYLDHSTTPTVEEEEKKKEWRDEFFYEWTQGPNQTTDGHNGDRIDHIPAVFGLIRKDYKYFYWPQTKYEQLFHVEWDLYEEYDIYNTTAQTSASMLSEIKERYEYLKERSRLGYPV